MQVARRQKHENGHKQVKEGIPSIINVTHNKATKARRKGKAMAVQQINVPGFFGGGGIFSRVVEWISFNYFPP